VAATLTDFLGTRSPEQIAAILAARPDATVPPVPRDLSELAERLEIFSSVATAFHQLPAPAVQLVEVLQLLGPDPGERSEVARWLGRPAGDPDLTATLDQLTGLALAWPDGAAIRLTTPLYQAFRYPLRLGAPAAGLLARYPAEHLRPIARALGVRSGGRKPELIAGIAEVLTDPERVRELVGQAGPAVRTRLHRLATDGPAVEHFAAWYGYHQPDQELRWAAERGLVLADSWGVPQLPREAAVALRGPGWRAPFTPRPPRPTLRRVTDDAVEREAAAAGGGAVGQLTAVLEAVAGHPPALLKAGGLGVKEVRRLAKAIGGDPATVRLWLELAYDAELVGPVRDRSGTVELLPTGGYDEWAEAEPADRLAVLLPVWLELATAPLLATGGDRKPAPVLLREHEGLLAASVRHRVLQLASGLPPGRGVAPGADLIEPVGWRCPLLAAQHSDLPRLVAATWQEAQLLGVVAHGALSSLGRALAGGAEPAGMPAGAGAFPIPDPDELAAACRKLLPAAAGEAVFQADLTALVPGTPTRSLADLLDATADRESRGGAVTWRFTPGSVRRALDAGHRPAELLAALRTRATTGTLPQPLEYLVTDLARRHGAMRVRAVGCVLRAEDPALLAELAGARTLRGLGLSVIAPTVLGSARPAGETLAALRAAGYAPVGESPDGVPLVERAERRRAGPARQRRRPISGVPAAGSGIGSGIRSGVAGGAGAGRETPAGTRVGSGRGAGAGSASGAGPAGDQLALATRLLAAPVPAPRSAPGARPGQSPLPELAELDPTGADSSPAGGLDQVRPVDLDAELAELADQLGPGERRLLAHAIETGCPVTINYVNAQGGRTTRVIDSAELDGGHLIAWCHLREDERMFSLRRIDTVAPAR
jgi:hypothetical protein